MKVTSRISWDIETMTVLEHHWSDWSGTWELAKGKDVAKQQLDTQTAMQTAANQRQAKLLDMMTGKFSPFLGGKTGYDPQMLAAMRSQFLNQNTGLYNQAGQQVRAALGARGEGSGQLPVSGDYTRGIASLLGARAGSQSQGLLGLDVQNAQQALNNQFNAGNLLSGNAATLTGTQGVAGSGASSALGNYIQAANSGIAQSFMGGLGQGLGGGLGAFATGGFGKILSGAKPGAMPPVG